MKIPVEPACYTLAVTMHPDSADAFQAFEDGVNWLESFFSCNRHCRIPMTEELRAAVSLLFPFELAARTGRMGKAQELVSTILRVIDRFRAAPSLEYSASEAFVADLSLSRSGGVYADDDVWLSWCDLLAQCLRESRGRREAMCVFIARVNSCVGKVCGGEDGSVRWIHGGRDVLPDGTVDPDAMRAMRERAKRSARDVVWEDSGHQAPVSIKRLISRVVEDCAGVVIRFGSTYFNPAMRARCSVSGSGTDADSIHRLDCTLSDGVVTLRGAFRTSAETVAEQLAALSFVTQSMRERCAEAKFDFVG